MNQTAVCCSPILGRDFFEERWTIPHITSILFDRYIISDGFNKLLVDLVYDTLLSAFTQLDTFSYKSTERTWLTTILKNTIYRYLKRNSSLTYQGRDELKKMSCNDNAGSLIHDFGQPMISKEFLDFLC